MYIYKNQRDIKSWMSKKKKKNQCIMKSSVSERKKKIEKGGAVHCMCIRVDQAPWGI